MSDLIHLMALKAFVGRLQPSNLAGVADDGLFTVDEDFAKNIVVLNGLATVVQMGLCLHSVDGLIII